MLLWLWQEDDRSLWPKQRSMGLESYLKTKAHMSKTEIQVSDASLFLSLVLSETRSHGYERTKEELGVIKPRNR